MAATTLVIDSKLARGTKSVIRRFTFRRVLLSASLFGLFTAIESVAQSAGIIAAYPDVAPRARFIHGLASNGALGLFYGDSHVDIISAGGYMDYRILPILSLVLAIWSLMFITKMLRGQEENGRWELLLTGDTSATSATRDTVVGAGGGVLFIFLVVATVLGLSSKSPKLSFSFSSCLLYSLTIVGGAAISIGIGTIASQLAATRRRANLYGIGILLLFFILRGIGNTIESLAWVKNLTPFGWIDKLHPFVGASPVWLFPTALLTLITCSLGIWLAGKRDIGESFIADSDSAKPNLRLLHSQLGFGVRQTRSVLGGWLFTSVALSALIASIDKTVAKSMSSTNGVTKTLSNLTGNSAAHIQIAYLSAASYITLIILMMVAATGLGAVREEEASSRLDNFVSGTISRSSWLSKRLLLLEGSVLAITLLSGLAVWLLAAGQGIHTSFAAVVLGGLNILGPIAFLLGLGTLLYGTMPRLAVIAMYVVAAWSFTIDLIASAGTINKYLADTSLLHHVALVPAAAPHWESFILLTLTGLAFTALGVLGFQRRDLEAE